MRAYSQDLRDRIIAALDAHEDTRENIAQRYRVSRSFVQKLLRRWRDTARSAALPHGGGRPRALVEDADRIRQAVARQPDATLAELCDRVKRAGGAPAYPSMMHRELKRLKMTRKKKSLHASERETPRVRRARTAYWDWMADATIRRLKFIDESGLNLSLTRGYGRAPMGERVVDAVPQQPGSQTWTLLGTLRVTGISAPWVLSGAVDGLAFEVYVREVLGPTLKPGDIVLMDNLPAHTVAAIESALHARGAQVHCLPPYSPDLNPIEQCWSKIKTALRAAKARTLAALLEALKTALKSVSKQDAIAWFIHCGYCVYA